MPNKNPKLKVGDKVTSIDTCIYLSKGKHYTISKITNNKRRLLDPSIYLKEIPNFPFDPFRFKKYTHNNKNHFFINIFNMSQDLSTMSVKWCEICGTTLIEKNYNNYVETDTKIPKMKGKID